MSQELVKRTDVSPSTVINPETTSMHTMAKGTAQTKATQHDDEFDDDEFDDDEFDESILDGPEIQKLLNPPPSQADRRAFLQRLSKKRRSLWRKKCGYKSSNKTAGTGPATEEPDAVDKNITKVSDSTTTKQPKRYPDFPEREFCESWYDLYFRAAKQLCRNISDPQSSLSIVIWLKEVEGLKIALRVLSPGEYGGLFLEDIVDNGTGTMVPRIRSMEEMSWKDVFGLDEYVYNALQHFNWGAEIKEGEKEEVDAPSPAKKSKVSASSMDGTSKPMFSRIVRKTVAHPFSKNDLMVEINFYLKK